MQAPQVHGCSWRRRWWCRGWSCRWIHAEEREAARGTVDRCTDTHGQARQVRETTSATSCIKHTMLLAKGTLGPEATAAAIARFFVRTTSPARCGTVVRRQRSCVLAHRATDARRLTAGVNIAPPFAGVVVLAKSTVCAQYAASAPVVITCPLVAKFFAVLAIGDRMAYITGTAVIRLFVARVRVAPCLTSGRAVSEQREQQPDQQYER